MDIRNFFVKTSSGPASGSENGGQKQESNGEEVAIKKPRIQKPLDAVESILVKSDSASADSMKHDLIKSDPAESNSVVINVKLEQFDNDIGLLLEKQIDDSSKMLILTNAWKPGVNYKFPTSGPRNLKFNRHWLDEWNWLVYSPSKDGGFCKYCAVFYTTVGKQNAPPGKLVKIPYKNWKNAREDFRTHDKCQYHVRSLERAGFFIATQTGAKESIEQALQEGRKQRAEKNRTTLGPIVKSAIFLARRGLAFRGHRDSGPLDITEPSRKEEGNFRALLKFRVDSGDDVLKHHLQNAAGNASYISWQIQNEIISAFNNIILNKLVQRVNDAECFSILCDETTDVSNISQMTLCVRFVQENTVREEFLQFVPVTDMTGKGLAKLIVDSMDAVGLDKSKLVGQGYDGARSMSGHLRGTQAIIREILPKALYVHCCSHSLNLSISEGCSLPSIQNCMGTIESTYNFFNSPKRMQVLKQRIETIENDKPRAQKLKRMCPTRWIQRHDSLQAFIELFEPVVLALEDIRSWTDKTTSTNAQLLLNSIEKFDFIVNLFVVGFIFEITLPLSTYLQTESLDLSVAVGSAETTRISLESFRDKAQETFASIFEKVKDLCVRLGVDINLPRAVRRQKEFQMSTSASCEEYYRSKVFIPFLDSIVDSLVQKFQKHQETLIPFQTLLKSPEEEPIANLARFYDIESFGLAGEVILWRQTVLTLKPANAIDALKNCNGTLLPTISSLLKIMATLPVTTCTAERSFSSLKTLKTYLRNTTGEQRLNGLALMFIHEDISVSEHEVLDDLSRKERRLNICL